MTKDEMKNKISMALKDPILQQGFEIICKENAELKEVHESDKRSLRLIAEKGAELEKELKSEKEYSATLRKEIDEYTNSHTLCAKYKELEKEISILLSCKNCPENKGGYICQKEYEDKCLAQKIQYIKELQEENEELEYKLKNLSKVAEVRLSNWQKYEEENKELKEKLKPENCLKLLAKEGYIKFTSDQLTKAKEIIRQLCSMVRELNNPNVQLTNVDYSLSDTEQFLKECE